MIVCFNSLRFYHKRIHETAITSQTRIQHAQMHFEAGDSTQSPPSIFYWAFIYDRYITVYARYMHLICFGWTLPNPLQLHAAFRPAGSPKRAGTFQTWTFCRSFRFWRQKGQQLEAGVCQSSTTRCWCHRHGCQCVIPCLCRWPNSKDCFCRGAYWYGMVKVALPWRKHGKSGTRPRRSSVLPTY